MRNTKQRDCIFDIVNNSHNHFTAYQVYDEAKKIISNISLGTVYRNLSWLCDNNKIGCLLVNGAFRYDRNVIHDHFICVKCNNIIDIPRVEEEKKYIFNNLVIDYEIKYRGICIECQKKEGL